MDLIIETDIGHDPDDFFAICYLISAGVNIRAITITPGDPDQVAITKLILRETGLNIPIGVSKLNRDKLSSGSIHHSMLNKYGRSKIEAHDGPGDKIVGDVLKEYPDCELFVIGPVSSIGKYLKNHNVEIKRATMQGGFLGYNLHNFPCKRLSKFENSVWQPTFNLNGDIPAGLSFISANIKERMFVGKNVCHTVIYNRNTHNRGLKIKDRASELFKEAMDMYLKKHGEKKFHDPSAACCHLHPEIGSWVIGNTKRMEKGWGTELCENGDLILADIDYGMLWENILNFK